MWTVEFWKAASERAARTFAQAALGVLGVQAATGVISPTGVFDVAWGRVLGVALLAAIVSVLMSLGTQAAQGEGPGVTEVPAKSINDAIRQATRKITSP